jgi:hypothetical protein
MISRSGENVLSHLSRSERSTKRVEHRSVACHDRVGLGKKPLG